MRGGWSGGGVLHVRQGVHPGRHLGYMAGNGNNTISFDMISGYVGQLR